MIKMRREMNKPMTGSAIIPGLDANAIQSAPTASKKFALPPLECVSQIWIDVSGSKQTFGKTPVNTGCLDLDLPDSEFPDAIDKLWIREVPVTSEESGI